MASQQL
jgi:hypothetical protein